MNKKMVELGSQRSAIRELFEFGKQRAQIVGAENVFDFSIGNPTVESPACVQEAINEIFATMPASAVHAYSSAQGDVNVRNAIAGYITKTHNFECCGDDFYITCGAAAALTLTMNAICSGGETIATIAPYFPEYKVFVEGANAKFAVVPAKIDDFQIDFDALANIINEETVALIINSPNNPSGAIYSAETLTKLADFLRAKQEEYNHDIYIIADEPYREIVYGEQDVPFVPNFYDNTIVCYSYSKSLSLPGERIGWVLVSPKIKEAKQLYAGVAGAGRALGFVCAPALFQQVIMRCIGKTADIDEYKQNRDLLVTNLREMGYECAEPQGAFYLFVKSPEPDAVAFCERAKQYDLLLVAGDGFGCEGYVRMAYCVQKSMLERSFPAFKKLMESYK